MAKFTKIEDEYTDEDKYGTQSIIDEIEESPVEEELESAEEEDFGDMSEVEIRLEEANCLKALLHNSLFEEPLSPIARRVEKKVRGFIHQELRSLLNLSPAIEPTPLFSETEMAILKALAKRAIDRLPQGVAPAVKAEPEAEPQKVQAEVVVKKMPSPALPVKVRKAKTPKMQLALPDKSDSAKEDERQVKLELKQKEIEVELPNGIKVTGLSGQTQVRPPRGTAGQYPSLSADQQASYFEQQALVNKPMEGELGLMVAAVDRLNKS